MSHFTKSNPSIIRLPAGRAPPPQPSLGDALKSGPSFMFRIFFLLTLWAMLFRELRSLLGVVVSLSRVINWSSHFGKPFASIYQSCDPVRPLLGIYP